MRFALRFSPVGKWLPAVLATLEISSLSILSSTFTVTNVNDTGPGSLRIAISNANAVAGMDLVDFNIPGSGPFTINLASVLPSITETLTIDATTQPGYLSKPLVELNGAVAVGNGTGIYLLAPNCVVKGLAINRFAREAIRTETYGGNTIQANFIGTGPFGTNSVGNGNGGSGFGGITILSAGNLIGGPSLADRNLISGGNRWGIYLFNATAVSNQIQGNFVGVDVTGTNRLGNGTDGINLFGAVGNLIGPSNVISGNAGSGVYLYLSANSNRVQGNLIGTDCKGVNAISNSAHGVTIVGGVGNTIGGTNSVSRNVISGNGGAGVNLDTGASGNLIQGNYIGTDGSGRVRIGNLQSGVDIHGAGANTVGPLNLISGNGNNGVLINTAGATGNLVQGNFIGTDASGTNALGNGLNGVFVAVGASNNVVGGDRIEARNLISGNSQNGVYVTDANSTGNQIRGNFIGTDVSGLRRLGNGLSGVRIEAPLNLVGGSSTAERNVISGNTNSHGVYLTGSLAYSNTVAGNFIGTDATGAAALGNGYPSGVYSGVGISSAAANTIGGTSSGARNVISGNADKGIYVYGITATRNVIQGNYIGTDASGINAVANVNGGIYLFGSPTNTIGGASAGASNLISGNGAAGIYLNDIPPSVPGANFNLIQGNRIGTKADGVTALGNFQHGIEIAKDTSSTANGSSNNIVGGLNPGEGNIIANAVNSGYDGVRIRDGTRNNLVRGNSIYGNGGSNPNGLGIDLSTDGVNPNDNCDVDGFPFANLLQNFPYLSNAVSGATFTWVRGSLNSAASSTFLLQFYANAIVEPSGYGEGQFYLGDAMITTSPGCTTDFTTLLTNLTVAGYSLTATATDSAGNTSEFGPAIVSVPQPTLSLLLSNAPFSATLFWANLETGFILQQATSLNTPIIWTTVTNTPTVINNQFSVTLASSGGNLFYRLALP